MMTAFVVSLGGGFAGIAAVGAEGRFGSVGRVGIFGPVWWEIERVPDGGVVDAGN